MSREIATNGNYTTIRNLLIKQRNEIAAAIPKHMNPDRTMRIALTTFRTNPALLECSQESLLGALMQCSQLGFELNNMTGHVYLIPFKNNAQLIIGYQGMLDLMYRTGKFLHINTFIVYENEYKDSKHFEISFGTEPRLKHIPMPPSERGEKKIGVYMVAALKGGGTMYEWMWAEEVLKIRDESQAYKAGKRYKKNSIWDDHEEAMWRKTVIRRAAKYLPKSVEIQNALTVEATPAAEAWDIQTLPDTEPAKTMSDEVADKTEEKTQALSEQLSLEAEFEADAKKKGI